VEAVPGEEEMAEVMQYCTELGVVVGLEEEVD